MKQTVNLVLISIVAAVLLVLMLRMKPRDNEGSKNGVPLVVYCAAGIKPPVEAVAKEYEKTFGIPVQIQYGGSGTLLSNLRVSKVGDLFIAADDSYLRIAETNGLIEETITLAQMSPVVAVLKGNPKNIRSLSDLHRVNLALANPDAAAVGKVTREVLSATGDWEMLRRRARVFKPTVNDIANDVMLGTVDAGIVWDATASQYSGLEAVLMEPLSHVRQSISIGVLRSSKAPRRALHFARYLGARDRGLKEFEQRGYKTAEGDVWVEQPELMLYSGGINRLAIEETIEQFEQREGVKITRVYNGCGILVAQMKAGQNPDAYFACDASFLREVQDRFEPPITISRSDMVILTQKGNPKSILRLADLSAPGLKLGIAHETQSALGSLTVRLLESLGLLQAVLPNVRVQTPTADLLVNQMRTGALDAAIVYQANAQAVKEVMTVISIADPAAHAVQPFAVGMNSSHRLLARRLLKALCSPESRARFERAGFEWQAVPGAAGGP